MELSAEDNGDDDDEAGQQVKQEADRNSMDAHHSNCAKGPLLFIDEQENEEEDSEEDEHISTTHRRQGMDSSFDYEDDDDDDDNDDDDDDDDEMESVSGCAESDKCGHCHHPHQLPRNALEVLKMPLIDYLCALNHGCSVGELQALFLSKGARGRMVTHLQKRCLLRTVHLRPTERNITLHAHNFSARSASLTFACGGYLNLTVSLIRLSLKQWTNKYNDGPSSASGTSIFFRKTWRSAAPSKSAHSGGIWRWNACFILPA